MRCVGGESGEEGCTAVESHPAPRQYILARLDRLRDHELVADHSQSPITLQHHRKINAHVAVS